jgi:hypothetical protein
LEQGYDTEAVAVGKVYRMLVLTKGYVPASPAESPLRQWLRDNGQ